MDSASRDRARVVNKVGALDQAAGADVAVPAGI
jgi:hypothetical protein